MTKTTAPSFSKAKCCGNCENRSKYKCGGDMYGYDEGDYFCRIHMEVRNDNMMRQLLINTDDICNDFKRRVDHCGN